MTRILLADDNKELQDSLTMYLKLSGFEVVNAYDGNEALAEYKKGGFDLILLDVMMPGKDGFEVLKEIRKEDGLIKIIMLTALSEIGDKLNGLEEGANDYVTKPFDSRELVARIKVQTRNLNTNILRAGKLSLNMDTHEVTVDGELAGLTPREYEVLQYLWTRSSRVITREELCREIWGYEYDAAANGSMNVCLNGLRNKLPRENGPETCIETVRGVGYRFRYE